MLNFSAYPCRPPSLIKFISLFTGNTPQSCNITQIRIIMYVIIAIPTVVAINEAIMTISCLSFTVTVSSIC